MNTSHLPKLAPIRTLADLPRLSPFRRPKAAVPRQGKRRQWKASRRDKRTTFGMENER